MRRSRIDLIDYLEMLTDDQWNHDSLCEGWQNRDVLAHLILEFHYNASKSWKDFIRSGFRINVFLKQTAIAPGRQSPTELMNQFRLMIDEQHKPPGISVMNILTDLLIHEQDIRIPLGHIKPIAPDSLRLIFSNWEPGTYNMGERIAGLPGRLKGLKFTITDLNMTKGNGNEVIGSASDILHAIVGRTITLDRLEGDGVNILKKRLRS